MQIAHDLLLNVCSKGGAVPLRRVLILVNLKWLNLTN